MSEKMNELRKLSQADLLEAIEANREEMYKLRFNQATGELKNVNLIRQNRRELARLKTVLAELSLAAQQVSGEGK